MIDIETNAAENIFQGIENYEVRVVYDNNYYAESTIFNGKDNQRTSVEHRILKKDGIELKVYVNHETKKIAVISTDTYTYYFHSSVNEEESPNLDIDFEVVSDVFKKPYDNNITGHYNYYEKPKYEAYQTSNRQGYYSNEYSYEAFRFLKIKIIRNGTEVIVDVPFKKPLYGTGKVDVASNIIIINASFYGEKFEYSYKLMGNSFRDSFYAAMQHLTKNQFSKSNEILILSVLAGSMPVVPTDGVAKIEKKYAKAISEMERVNPQAGFIYKLLHSKKKTSGASANTLLGSFLENCNGNIEKMAKELISVYENYLKPEASKGYNYSDADYSNLVRAACVNLSGAKEKETERRAKTEWNLRNNLVDQADGLGITKSDYPELLDLIESKRVPLCLFHESGEPDNLINIEFDLWEKALKRKGWKDIIAKIAADASRRKLYDKKITPYLSYLFKIETYLKKHTGKKWTAMPKFVESQWELEMAEADENGTTKKRSAMTPIVDNEKLTITVPYVSMAIAGRQTTYCYSLNYYVFEENNIDAESGTPILSDLSKKLNGRDDYGLMYFTLTGTNRNTGYPTFLIIFERLKDKTRVHFHRVHPSRYRNGKPTPASKLIEECYRYMAGNVRAEEIYKQQGDLIFIKATEQDGLESAKEVNEFESHCFVKENGEASKLIENKNKSIKNRLGFIYCDQKFTVQHPEHENLENMPAGWYEIRRCKSYENNPVSVWSLNID